MHAWLVLCWPAFVWSVYGQVAAAAAVLLVRGRLGRLMVGLVRVGSIALLPVVVPPHVVYAAGMSVSVLVSGVVVCPSVVLCSLFPLVGRVCIGSVVVFCCVPGHGCRRAWRTTVLLDGFSCSAHALELGVHKFTEARHMKATLDKTKAITRCAGTLPHLRSPFVPHLRGQHL